MIPVRLHLAYKNIKRLRDIVSILVKHGFYPVLESMHLTGLISMPRRIIGKKMGVGKEALGAAIRLRLALEELGPTFVKFGQILSTRPDVISEEFITELLKLQDEVPPFPFEDVLDTVEKEFKKPAREIFPSIEKIPVAAASIAQVHRATTASGSEVMIKVQRPGIEEIINTDLAILKYLARLMAKHMPEARIHDPAGMVEEFSRVIRKEMDFTLEASYMEKFRANFAHEKRIEIPGVYWEYTRKRLLTMDRVSGIKIDNVSRLREEGIDTKKLASLLVEIFFTQVFDYGLFHGDLHAGNIFVINQEKIALLDFGIVGRMEDELKGHVAEMFLDILNEDFKRLTNLYLKMGVLPEDIDEEAFSRDYYDLAVHYLGRPLSHIRIGDLFMDHIRLISRYNIKIPRDILLFSKCILELEGLARHLYPDADLIKECEPFAAKAVRRRLLPEAVISEGISTVNEYRDLVENMPGYTRKILKKILSDNLAIEFIHRGLEDLVGEMDRSSNRLTFAIIMAAMVIGSSLVIASEAGPSVMGYPALGIVGFMIAAILGLGLAFQILRSGKF